MTVLADAAVGRQNGVVGTVEEFYAKDREAWRGWLEANHASERAVWLVYDKGAGRALSYDDIVEEALCFGWVDSKPGTVSATQSKLYVSARKPASAWSKANKARIDKLTAQGLMTQAGQEAVDRARRNGAWDKLNASDALEVPPELARALAANPAAKAFYDGMAPSSQRIILEWIYAAKTDATRDKRVAETVDLAAEGIKAHHYRQ